MQCKVTGCTGCSCGGNSSPSPTEVTGVAHTKLLQPTEESGEVGDLLDQEIVDDFGGQPIVESQPSEDGETKEDPFAPEPPVRDVKVTIGKLNPDYIKAVALPKMVYGQSLSKPTTEKEKSAVSFTIHHYPEATAVILDYARNGVPGRSIKIEVVDEVARQVSEWTFSDAQVFMIDFDSFSMSQHYGSNYDFKCDFAYSKLDIKYRSI